MAQLNTGLSRLGHLSDIFSAVASMRPTEALASVKF